MIENINNLCYIICSDFSCSIFLINRLLLTKLYSKIKLQQMNTLINIQRIDTNYYIINQFIHINIFIKATDKVNDIIIIHMCKKFYVINNLKINMLIDIDILKTENINLKFFINKMIFINYKDITVSMQV